MQLETQAIITTNTLGAYCFLNDNGIVYDLNSLNRKNDDYNKTFTNKDFLSVNLCSRANNNCPNKTALATYYLANNQCISLSGDEKAFSNYTISYDNITFSSSLKSYLPPGDNCRTNTSTKYQIVYNLVCNKNQTTPIFNADNFDINKCYNEITITTKEACPQFNVYGLWNAIVENRYAFGSIILGLGLILTFYGNKFLLFTQIMTGVIITLLFSLYFIMSNIPMNLQTWQFWLIIGFCALLGALGGYFMSQVEWLVAVLLASIVGFVGGEFLYTIALKYVQTNPVVVYWAVIVFSVVIGALVGYWLSTQIIIVATAIIGAYGVMRGAAFMIGYYPDEKQVYQLMNNKEWDQVHDLMTWHVYAYFIAFILTALLGIYIQCKYFNNSDKKNENDNKEQLIPPQHVQK